MNILANVLLLVAIVATIGLGAAQTHLPFGPDRGMYGIVYVIIQTPRWICLAVLLGMCVAKGAFPWPPDRGAQYFLVFTLHVLIGLGSLVCAATTLSNLGGVPPWMVRALSLAPYVVPASLMVFLAWFLNPSLQGSLDASAVHAVNVWWVVLFAVLVGAYSWVGAATYQWSTAHDRRTAAERAAPIEAEKRAKEDAIDREFRALSAESPIEDWIKFTDWVYGEGRRTAALEAISKRPNLAEDLGMAIASTNVPLSMKAMYLVGELPKPPAELGDAVREKARFVARIAETIDPNAPDSRDVLYEKVHSIAAGVQAAAHGLHRAGVDIRPELRIMAKACGPREKASPRDIAAGCERIIKYFGDLEEQEQAGRK